MSVHTYCTERVTGSDGREGANVIEGRVGVGGGIRDGNKVRGGNGNVDGDGDGDGAGTRTGVEANERTQDGNGDGSGTVAGTGTGVFNMLICREASVTYREYVALEDAWHEEVEIVGLKRIMVSRLAQ